MKKNRGNNMRERTDKKLIEEKKLGIESRDPIKFYVEDSMQLLIHKHVDKQRGEI
jgi:hypothetical protein